VGLNRNPQRAGRRTPGLAPGVAVRKTAHEILDAVLADGKPLDDALAQARWGHIEGRDRALARMLVATVLRRLGQIDDLIARAVEKKPPKEESVSNLLRLGAAQLLFMDVPPHAAVSTTVSLCEGRRARARGFVNAVLRRLEREARPWIETQEELTLNAPAWLRQRWVSTYGEETTRNLAAAHLSNEPPLDLTVKNDSAAWAAKLGGAALSPQTVRLRGAGAVEEIPGFEEGAWWVQDLAATLPARLLHVKPGERVADLCAAPGGKTAQLADAGALVTAVDQSPRRLERLKQNLERLRLNAESITADVSTWAPPSPFDAVLLDAPCSATGTLRRHPDIAWNKAPGDIETLAALQSRLLDRAAAMVKPGGRLVFSTCSLEAEEGERQARAFLERHAAWSLDPVRSDEISFLADAVTREGHVRTLPSMLADKGGIDGFFIARFRNPS
jgi:16S rRNA (cytosine967-C5)-methyltransferase